jgi:quinol monooxygenase YgiN
MGPTSVRMTVEWLVPLGETRPITIALHAVAADTRGARGCMGCSVSTDIGKGGVVRYIEDWQTEDDLRHRLRSHTFTQLVTLIEGATQPPRIEFMLPGATRGLDYAEEVRGTVM